MIAPPPRGRARLLLPNGREGVVPFANQTGFPEPVPQPRGSCQNPPSELSRSLSRHNHGAAGGGHPIIEQGLERPWPCMAFM